MKVIDLLNKIANGEEVPKKVLFKGEIFIFISGAYENKNGNELIYKDYICNTLLNEEVEILDEEDKDIPLIPDDELFIINDKLLDYNFRVVEEKINQVVKEFNEYRREHNE